MHFIRHTWPQEGRPATMQDSIDRQQQRLEEAATVRFLDRQEAQQVASPRKLSLSLSNDSTPICSNHASRILSVPTSESNCVLLCGAKFLLHFELPFSSGLLKTSVSIYKIREIVLLEHEKPPALQSYTVPLRAQL